MTVVSTTTWVDAVSVSPTPVLCIYCAPYMHGKGGPTGKQKNKGDSVFGSK